MSGFRNFLSKWTNFDQLAAAYSQPVFERVMTKQGVGRKGVIALAVLGAAFAMAFALGACALLATVAQQRYLEAYGSDAAATVTHRSFHTSTSKNGTKTTWQRLEYRFTSRSGGPLTGSINRPVSEFAAIPRGNAFTVMYSSRFPSINQPKGMRADVSLILLIAGFLSLMVMHLLLLVRRLWRWREVAEARSAGGSAVAAAA